MDQILKATAKGKTVLGIEFGSTRIGSGMKPDRKDTAGFEAFSRRCLAGVPIERAAIDCLKQGDEAC